MPKLIKSAELLAEYERLSIELEGRYLAENTFSHSPIYIVNSIVRKQAPKIGVNYANLTPSQFKGLATKVRTDLERTNNEVYSDSEWKKITAAAYGLYSQQYGPRSGRQEEDEEERNGWPASEDDTFVEPHEFVNGYEINRGPRPPFDHNELDDEFDHATAGSKTRFDNSSEVGSSVHDYTVDQSREEDEEIEIVRSKLKALLNKRKEIAKLASEATRKVEAEGAKAFHKFRTAFEHPPYDSKTEKEEHLAWLNGWMKEAERHYASKDQTSTKKKRK